MPLTFACLAAFTAAAILGPSVPLPRAAILAPIAYALAVLADLSTALILMVTWRASSPRRSTIVLVLSFFANASLLLVAMLVLPLVPTVAPVLQAAQYFGIWIFIGWHVLAAAGGLVYVVFRNDHELARPSLRFTLTASATATLLVGAAIFAASNLGARPAPSGVEILAVYLLILAGVLNSRLREPGPVERALAFGLFALAAEMTIFLLGAYRYTTPYYAGSILVMGGALFVFVAAMQILIAARMKLGAIEKTLDAVAGTSERRAGRISSVWQIARQAEAPESERVRNVLTIAAEGLRCGRPMMGFLSYLDGERLVVEEAVFTGFGAGRSALEARVPSGASFPLGDTIANLLHEGRAQSLDEASLMWHDGMIAHAIGVRSFVGARMTIAGRTHFVYFASPESMVDEPFSDDDRAYVDVVASFFFNLFEQEQHFRQIRFEIEHDSLTGLENQVQFRSAVRDEIRGGRPFALAFVDIDQFRHINVKEGFQIGDALLVEVAQGLVSRVRENRVARMSGDLFAILVRGVDSAAPAAHAVESYAELFDTPFSLGELDESRVLRVGASIGVALHPSHGASVEDLARRADVALKEAKKRGGSESLIFDASLDSLLDESRLRFIELADAIATDQLALVYQPTFELGTRRIVGAEALVRWDHPERGRLLPVEFIDFAERNNLIGALTVWVFLRVMRDIASVRAWPPGFRINFNVAAQMLDDVPFISMIDQALRAHPHIASRLGIEITESAAMQNVDRSKSTIDLFRSLGVSVAIDDFGTGHSSLSYLKNLTVDVIKIDRSFVGGLSLDERDNAIVQMMLDVTERFGFASLAEGIETECQLAWLLEHGCRFGQGYLIAEPAPFEVLLERLDVNRAA